MFSTRTIVCRYFMFGSWKKRANDQCGERSTLNDAQGTPQQNLIVGTRAVATEVERDVLESVLFAGGDHGFAHSGREHELELAERDFDTCDFFVPTYS